MSYTPPEGKNFFGDARINLHLECIARCGNDLSLPKFGAKKEQNAEGTCKRFFMQRAQVHVAHASSHEIRRRSRNCRFHSNMEGRKIIESSPKPYVYPRSSSWASLLDFVNDVSDLPNWRLSFWNQLRRDDFEELAKSFERDAVVADAKSREAWRSIDLLRGVSTLEISCRFSPPILQNWSGMQLSLRELERSRELSTKHSSARDCYPVSLYSDALRRRKIHGQTLKEFSTGGVWGRLGCMVAHLGMSMRQKHVRRDGWQ